MSIWLMKELQTTEYKRDEFGVPRDFCGDSYMYKKKIIGVCRGLAVNFAVGWYGTKKIHRVSPEELPICLTAEEAQSYLDKFAKANRLVGVV